MNIDIEELFRDFLNSKALEQHKESVYGNDGWIDDPERRERIEEAAIEGGDGSTHAEVIQDWYDALSYYLEDVSECLEVMMTRHIEQIELFHEQNGTLHNQIG
jgi:hypothetical protein